MKNRQLEKDIKSIKNYFSNKDNLENSLHFRTKPYRDIDFYNYIQNDLEADIYKYKIEKLSYEHHNYRFVAVLIIFNFKEMKVVKPHQWFNSEIQLKKYYDANRHKIDMNCFLFKYDMNEHSDGVYNP